MTIGEKIALLRDQANLTQNKLAELSSISEISIRKYEAGDRKPKFEQLQKIAKALNVNPSFFIEEELKTAQFETVGDLMTMVFALKEQLGLCFEYTKNDDGNIDINSVKLKFENDSINHLLARVIIDENTANQLIGIKKQQLANKQGIDVKNVTIDESIYRQGNRKMLTESPALLAEL